MTALTPDQAESLAAELEQLATRIARMRGVSRRNPEAFHEDRSELAGQARAIARRLRVLQKR